jgi:Spy/CpxP family protein refolding chaperone
MMLPRLLLGAALACAVTIPALAQTTPLPLPIPVASGTITGSGAHQNMGAHIRQMWQRVESLIGITPAQLRQLEVLRLRLQQSQAAGSPPNYTAMRATLQQVLQILTPAQQQQLRQEIQKFHRQHPPGTSGSPPPRD